MMKRYPKKGNNAFARYGLKGHSVRVKNTYRGGVRL